MSFNDSRFRYYTAEKHTTLGMARKLALEQARGEWIGFLDCDDVWYRDKLSRQLAVADERGRDVGLVYCDTDFIRSGSKGIWREYTSKSFHGFEHLPEGELFSQLSEACFLTLVSALIRRETLLSAGGVDPTLKQAEDYDMFLKVAAISKIAAVDDVCCAYRLHDHNLTWSQSFLNYVEPIALLEKYRGSRRIDRAVKVWRAAFAWWSLKHRSVYRYDIWLRGLLSPQFVRAAYLLCRQKFRQLRYKSARQPWTCPS